MGIYSDPPYARSFADNKASLLVCWWCTLFAGTVIMFRVSGRYIRSEKLFTEDRLAFYCLVPLFLRMACVHVVLLYGTNNAAVPDGGFSADELRLRMIGSRMVLASRVFYAATLWMLKFTITEFFKRLTRSIWTRSHEITLQCIRYSLLVTFIAVVIADISECRPTSNYWQVEPDPGPQCRQGFAQMLTMGVANIVTDIALVVFPVPVIFRSQMPLKRKIGLILLFKLSIIPVVITLCRMPSIINRHGDQHYRSIWASVEILFATAVANGLVLGSFVRDRGVKKIKWKASAEQDGLDRTLSRRGTAITHWGSDEDLVRDLGLGVQPDLREGESLKTPRMAPMARAAGTSTRKVDGSWGFPGSSEQDVSDDEEIDTEARKHPYHDTENQRSPTDVSAMSPPRRESRTVPFFDISNLLGDHDGPRKTSQTSTESSTVAKSLDSYNPPPPQKGSSTFLQDIGGLLSEGGPPANPPPARRTSYGWHSGNNANAAALRRESIIPSNPSNTRGFGRGIELQSIPQARPVGHTLPDNVDFQDIGGLLKPGRR